jgi:uncharacterized membrane protein YeaQ/YmgE (transglycosylase-associated protein family)
MAAMTPFFTMLHSLEGFELVCFWLAAFVGTVLTGFLLDWLMDRQGFGPFVNSVLALIGAFIGLYVKYNFLSRFGGYEPYLSFVMLFAAPVCFILSLSFMRTRVF